MRHHCSDVVAWLRLLGGAKAVAIETMRFYSSIPVHCGCHIVRGKPLDSTNFSLASIFSTFILHIKEHLLRAVTPKILIHIISWIHISKK